MKWVAENSFFVFCPRFLLLQGRGEAFLKVIEEIKSINFVFVRGAWYCEGLIASYLKS